MKIPEKSSTPSFLETIVLLALNDRGWFGNSEHRIKFGLAGAIIFELAQLEAINIMDDMIHVNSNSETGDKVLDSALKALSKSDQKLSIKKSISRLVYKGGLRWKLLIKNLIEKNILIRQEARFLWIIYQDKYPLVNSEIKKQVILELYLKLMGKYELSGNDLMLLSIMRTCKMVDKNFIHLDHFLNIKLKIKKITRFREPLKETTRLIKKIQEATRQSIFASNVMIHP
jgi:golgi phosphoprotein 3